MTRYPVRPGVPTENGWPMVNANKTVSVQVVPAARRVPLLRGDVATILNAFIILYNRRVEKITSQVWGWSADNDVWNSNHMSATAIDIGAPKYPWGTYRMDGDTIRHVEALLRDFKGVVFWGRRWRKPDEMHYQIGLPPSDSRVHALAVELNNGYLGAYGKPAAPKTSTPPPKPPTPKETAMTDDDRIKLNELHALFFDRYPSRFDLAEVKAGKKKDTDIYRGRLSDYILNIDNVTWAATQKLLPEIAKQLEELTAEVAELRNKQ